MLEQIDKEINCLEDKIKYLKRGQQIINKILEKFSKFGISFEHLKTKTRKQEVVYLRSMFIYLLKKEFSLTKISKIMDLHHTTIINSLKIIEDIKETKDVKYFNTFNLLCLE